MIFKPTFFKKVYENVLIFKMSWDVHKFSLS